MRVGQGSPQVNSIRLTDGYAGPLTIGPAVTTGALELRTGDIAQGANTTLTVTGRLDWSGGRLNTGPVAARLRLTGSTATGTIDPGGGTLRSGDALTLDNQAALTLLAGTVLLTQDVPVDVASGAQVRQIATVIGGILAEVGGAALTQFHRISGPNSRWDAWNGRSDLPVLVNGGGLPRIHGSDPEESFRPGTFTANGASGLLYGNSSVAVGQDGTLVIDNSNTLDAKNGGLYVGTGGRFRTAALMRGQYARPEDEVLIKGKMAVAGGDVALSDPAYALSAPPAPNEHRFVTLRVTGDVVWSGGVYRPGIGYDLNNNRGQDVWRSNGKFTITGGAGGAVLGPRYANLAGGPYLTATWWVIEANDLQYAQPNTTVGFETPAQNQELNARTLGTSLGIEFKPR
ncbi:MAG: hypothetical protein K2X82_25535 [Gemmataceae bacterium]|nr:hypothetical protein [Gemmataceae bacterium]